MSKEFEETCQRILKNVFLENKIQYESRIVDSEEEVIKLARRNYNCQVMGVNKCLMKQKSLG